MVVISFLMFYRNVTNWMNTSGDVFQAVVSGLEPYTLYIIKVCAMKSY